MPMESQLGVKKETTWGTPVTVDRFFEFDSEGIVGDYRRIESESLRAGSRALRSDRWAPWYAGAAGPIEFPILTKGFGFWLEHMVGAVGTTGPTDSAYTHLGEVATLTGLGFTLQVNRPFHPSGTDQAFTFEGGKVARWRVSSTVGGILVANLECVFEDQKTATALATPSYPSGAEMMTFLGGQISVDSTDVDVKDVTISCDNGLDVERFYHRRNGLMKQPVETARRVVSIEAEIDFANLDHYNRYKAAVAADAEVEFVAAWRGPTLLGATTYPEFTVRIPLVRMDGDDTAVEGRETLMQKVTGVAVDNTTDSLVELEYVTADATP